jgi:hypothetical protein
MDRQAFNQAVEDGATAVRGVVQGVVEAVGVASVDIDMDVTPRPASSSSAAASAPAPAPAPAPRVQPQASFSLAVEAMQELTEHEQDMTLEQYVRALLEAKYAMMREEGEGEIARWEASAREGRKRLEGVAVV